MLSLSWCGGPLHGGRARLSRPVAGRPSVVPTVGRARVTQAPHAMRDAQRSVIAKARCARSLRNALPRLCETRSAEAMFRLARVRRLVARGLLRRCALRTAATATRAVASFASLYWRAVAGTYWRAPAGTGPTSPRSIGAVAELTSHDRLIARQQAHKARSRDGAPPCEMAVGDRLPPTSRRRLVSLYGRRRCVG